MLEFYTCDRDDDTSNDKRTKAKLTKISLAKLPKPFPAAAAPPPPVAAVVTTTDYVLSIIQHTT